MKHLHHIVPKHAGGSDDTSNLVEVSIAEHAELHLALYLEYGRWQDWYAAQGLSGQIGKEELIAEAALRGARKKDSKKRKTPVRKPLSEETKRRISEARKGKPAHNKGKKASKETRAKMSAAAQGRDLSYARSCRGEQKRGDGGRYITSSK